MKFINQLFTSIVIVGVYGSEEMKNSYIVVLKKDVTEVQNHINNYMASARMSGGQVFQIGHVYDSDIIKGYSGKFDENSLNFIKSQPEVDYVEKDGIVKAFEVQTSAPWGLARVSSENKVNATENEYHYDAKAGEGVNVYVIDTGIKINHPDFEGRAQWGITTEFSDGKDDGNGHGTHVAGTIAGKAYGVSKKAQLYAVKVLSDIGFGSNSGVIKGIEWAANHAKTKGGKLGNVANMSLGGFTNKAMNQAVKAASAHLTFVVAAGNENRDACRVSPASEESAITVAASTISDTKATFSNWGKCVDFIAPGENILSAWIKEEVSKTISGTSMASPHVAGIVAYHMSMAPQKMNLKDVQAVLTKSSVKNKISGFNSDTPNMMVNNGFH